MKRFTMAVEKALSNDNWYAALAVGLVLPDICGKLEDPGTRSGERYARWFDRFVRRRYTRSVGAEKQPHWA